MKAIKKIGLVLFHTLGVFWAVGIVAQLLTTMPGGSVPRLLGQIAGILLILWWADVSIRKVARLVTRRLGTNQLANTEAA